jgi:hypothetical protein
VTPLQSLIAAELAEPIDLRVSAMARAIAAAHGQASRAVLFYGSCLREEQLDGLMLDFYLIVSNYPAAYSKGWLALANRLIPPNVFPFAHEGLAAKYAVLSEADFAALCMPEAKTVSVWARFSQPVRLAWVTEQATRQRIVDAVAQASVTLATLSQPLAGADDSIALWKTGFAQTYRCELRAERNNRSASIVDSDPARYRRISAALPNLNGFARPGTERRWAQLRRRGKLASIARLAKASLTFAGGIDYLAWKINRHAGTKIEISAWQRRHPLLAAMTLVPKLLRQGAIK